MVRWATMTVLLATMLLTAGCAAIVVGAGAGAGVYTWIKGELIRPYANDFVTVEEAALASLDHLQIRVEEKTQGPSTTTIEGRQSNGTPVTIHIRTLRYDMTEVAIRCGYVGYWNRSNAELIHATLYSNL